MLWKCCTQYVQIWKTQHWPQDGKRSVFIPIPKKGNAKECSNYCTIVLISHTSKVMLKILQARLQQYVNCAIPDVQAWFRKGRATRDQIVNIHWIIEKAREFQKISTSILLTMPKTLTVWITARCVKRMWCPLSRSGGGLWLSLESPQGIRSPFILWDEIWACI